MQKQQHPSPTPERTSQNWDFLVHQRISHEPIGAAVHVVFFLDRTAGIFHWNSIDQLFHTGRRGGFNPSHYPFLEIGEWIRMLSSYILVYFCVSFLSRWWIWGPSLELSIYPTSLFSVPVYTSHTGLPPVGRNGVHKHNWKELGIFNLVINGFNLFYII